MGYLIISIPNNDRQVIIENIYIENCDFMLLFLGAGASKAFDIVDMKKLTQLAEGVMEKEGYGDLLDTIYTSRLGKAVTIDIEVILSILDYLSEPSVDKIGPAGEFLKLNLQEIMSKSSYPNRRKYRKIRRRIEQIIVKSCMSCNFDSLTNIIVNCFSLMPETLLNMQTHKDNVVGRCKSVLVQLLQTTI